MNGVRELLDCHRQNNSGAPLLVNTHGWVVGMGANLVAGIAAAVQPDIIIHIKVQGRPDELYLDDMISNKGVLLLRINPGIPNANPQSAALLRYRRLVRYFLGDSVPLGTLAFGNWLSNSSPLCIRSDKLRILDATGKEPLPRPYIYMALNGALVGLVASSIKNQCIGLGVVRSIGCNEIDGARVIFLLTPEPYTKLEKVDTIVLGTQRLPLDLAYANHRIQADAPYLLTSSVELVGVEGSKKANRRNLKRFRLKHLYAK
eukprot:CAMPEP_0204881256 /NCGR_PEP_ID=MMETSP1349-20130617/2538_1 /ASSEMBLY_ACC=CAM_ASM_000710 /TAXON_ID=215587 /ORGANISM="Aplanochytrium stocchinoi, Strain GSBS06" /LENGTH=259 /DNA_ID=CAMNT_0052040107 /DNA_START=221 /DNA_END=1000 /DNA_ORIENTATION=-